MKKQRVNFTNSIVLEKKLLLRLTMTSVRDLIASYTNNEVSVNETDTSIQQSIIIIIKLILRKLPID